MFFMMRFYSWWLLVLAGFALAGCGTGVIAKNARGDTLRTEISLGVKLPPGCATSTASISAGKKNLTVSYQEPTSDHGGAFLWFTTIYLSSPGGQAQAIRVFTNDARGGAMVTINNVAAPAQEFALCVTATNLDVQESPPALLTPSAR